MKHVQLLTLIIAAGTVGQLSSAMRAQTVPAVPAPAPTASHKAAAEELLEAMDYREIYDRSVVESVDEGIRAHPDTARMRNLMMDYAKRRLMFDALKPDLIQALCDELTEQQLKDIA